MKQYEKDPVESILPWIKKTNQGGATKDSKFDKLNILRFVEAFIQSIKMRRRK